MTRKQLTVASCVLGAITLAAIAFFVLRDGADQAETDRDPPSTEVVRVDQAAAEAVPAAIRRRGTINLPVETFYPPNEFRDGNGLTIIGKGPELAKAISERLGLEPRFDDVKFDSILPSVVDGKDEMAISSFTITDERKAKVDMVSYFRAGSGFFTDADARTDIAGITDLCGKSVAVASGVVQAENVAQQSEDCVSNGDKPVEVVELETQAEVTEAVVENQVQLGIADSRVVAYVVKQSGGELAKVGADYGPALYGVLVNKESGLTKAVQLAIQSLIDDGTYMAILERWGQEGGAVKRALINP